MDEEHLVEMSTAAETNDEEDVIGISKIDNIKQIEQVMEIEQKIPDLLNFASLAVQMLQSEQLASETAESRKSKFEQYSESYMNILQDISIGFSQQIINLEKAKIQPRPITKIPIDPHVKTQQEYWEDAINLIEKFKKKNINQNIAS